MAVEKRNIYFPSYGIIAICGLASITFAIWNSIIQNGTSKETGVNIPQKFQSESFHIQFIGNGFFLILLATLGIFATLKEKIIIHQIESVILALGVVISSIIVIVCYMNTYDQRILQTMGPELRIIVEASGIRSNYLWIGVFELIKMVCSDVLIFISFFK